MKPKQATLKDETQLHHKISIPRPDDWHVHFREGDILPLSIAASEKCFGRCVAMPNLSNPLTNASLVAEYGKQLAHHLSSNSKLKLLLTLYLTDETTIQDIEEVSKINSFFAVKWYPKGVTTNSSGGVSDIKNCYRILDKMQELDIPLLTHGESANPQDDVFDRERIFIETILEKVRNKFSNLRITMEHISSKDAVAYLKQSNDKTAATITPQHLLYNRNNLLGEKINPHLFCKPILKREEDRQALTALVSEGFPRVFLGSDSAPHTKDNKECSHGCAGIFSAPFLLEIITQIFDDLKALDKLSGFVSINGAKFYGFPVAKDDILLYRQESKIPKYIPVIKSVKKNGSLTQQAQQAQQAQQLIPLGAGNKIQWQARKK